MKTGPYFAGFRKRDRVEIADCSPGNRGKRGFVVEIHGEPTPGRPRGVAWVRLDTPSEDPTDSDLTPVYAEEWLRRLDVVERLGELA